MIRMNKVQQKPRSLHQTLLSFTQARKSKGLRIGMPWKGCNSKRWMSPLTMQFTSDVKARFKNLMSFTSLQNISKVFTSKLRWLLEIIRPTLSILDSNGRYLSNLFLAATFSNSSLVSKLK